MKLLIEHNQEIAQLPLLRAGSGDETTLKVTIIYAYEI